MKKILLLSFLLSSCATNGELGLAGHPIDCAVGIGHSDCDPSTPGYQRYLREGNTAWKDIGRSFLVGLTIAGQANNYNRPTSSAIHSQIDGEFKGWEGETIYKLLNGQIWQQSSYHYHYHYAYSPEVIIYSSGGYKMHVIGDDDQDVEVRQVQ